MNRDRDDLDADGGAPSPAGEQGDLAAPESEQLLPEISFDEQFYPARPRALGPRARLRTLPETPPPFAADARNPAYVDWLENMSMLGDARSLGRQLSGQAGMWLNPYAYPNPRAAVERASVWFTAYPISLITAPGQSFLAALGQEELWAAFEQIGIEAVHTGPVKRAGGISGWEHTPSVDGHFDRICCSSGCMRGNWPTRQRTRPCRRTHQPHRANLGGHHSCRWSVTAPTGNPSIGAG